LVNNLFRSVKNQKSYGPKYGLSTVPGDAQTFPTPLISLNLNKKHLKYIFSFYRPKFTNELT